MVRDALRESTTQETAEALLRHFVRKSSRSDPDRDKTDFIVTFLYRSLVPQERQIPAEMNVDEPSEFEEEIYTIIASEESAALPEEHRQLVREFPFIRQEVDDYGHFDQLMDSGVIQRAREIKQRFGDSFYHPRVLATIAAYNVYFGSRFDQLFKQTAQQIKKFASSVQQQGGSIMSRVDGDVTVQNLAAVEEQQTEIMQAEYGRAQEQFRNISRLKRRWIRAPARILMPPLRPPRRMRPSPVSIPGAAHTHTASPKPSRPGSIRPSNWASCAARRIPSATSSSPPIPGLPMSFPCAT